MIFNNIGGGVGNEGYSYCCIVLQRYLNILNLNSPLLAAWDEFKLWIKILFFAKEQCRNSKKYPVTCCRDRDFSYHMPPTTSVALNVLELTMTFRPAAIKMISNRYAT
jgi:hypothetical protein